MKARVKVKKYGIRKIMVKRREEERTNGEEEKEDDTDKKKRITNVSILINKIRAWR